MNLATYDGADVWSETPSHNSCTLKSKPTMAAWIWSGANPMACKCFADVAISERAFATTPSLFQTCLSHHLNKRADLDRKDVLYV